MATRDHIDRIEAEIITGTETEIDGRHLEDGWTKKDFDPIAA
jgi:hypothetical protein